MFSESDLLPLSALQHFVFCERQAALIHLEQVWSDDALTVEGMNDEARKVVLVAYQKRKQDEVLHPFLEEKTTVGLVPHLQALLLARHLRGDLDGYPPFIWR